jgi:hypothetical protein
MELATKPNPNHAASFFLNLSKEQEHATLGRLNLVDPIAFLTYLVY